MIVYSATKRQFIEDVRSNKIAKIVEQEVLRKLKRHSPHNERLSWENSLLYMSQVLWDNEIPDSAGVAIEYKLPLSNRRVDFILTGRDHSLNDTAVLVELKQWQEVEKTDKDAIVKTRFQHGIQETNHPSYQAWSYSALIQDYNETVRQEAIQLKPCAYLHNMDSDIVINDPFYAYHTAKAPAFISPDALKLAEFLKKYVKYGDSNNIMYRIEHGVIKPSKNLADSLASMLAGNDEFLMIDEQKLVYETAINLAHKAQSGKKKTLIVKGGPGTGKSVVAINLLVELTKREMVVQYVSKNSAPREVYSSKLKGQKKKTQIDMLFKGSGQYTTVTNNQFDALLVDEAHRLNEKSGMYGNLGENQIKELIVGSKLSVFFIDEAQRVTFKDIGSVQSIKNWANQLGSEVIELELESQFRCNGSDGYIAWVDNALQIRETANPDLNGIDYIVKVFDDPKLMHAAIRQKNLINNKARVVAGYCWDWAGKKNPDIYDILIPEYNYEAKWNLSKQGGLWAISENSVEEVGCIHTSQGLELDYIGVIIGPDFVIREGVAITDGNKRSSQDRSIRGFKTMLKNDPIKAKALADEIIKNTYRTLLTRGQKGCYIYCTDTETAEYFKKLAFRMPIEQPDPIKNPYYGLDLAVVEYKDAKPFITHIPIYDLKAAAGDFSQVQVNDDCMWVELPDYIKPGPDMFVMQVVGESMNKRIPNGSWCLFRAHPKGTRNGKVVLAQHRSIEDPDHGGSYTVKVYESFKSNDYESGNYKILLKPDSNNTGYSNIELTDNADEVQVIAEFLSIL